MVNADPAPLVARQAGPLSGRGLLVRAPDRLALAEALAAVGRPAAAVRVEVSPRRV